MPEKKPFLTYEQQISKLRDEKGLAIPDATHAIEILTQIGYFPSSMGTRPRHRAVQIICPCFLFPF
jgi:abortive infection bacteriophage resistance protein